jgi:predicted kinase
MARWHLVAGSTGAGKSTAAREIAERVGGVRFSMDEWMNALYWMFENGRSLYARKADSLLRSE